MRERDEVKRQFRSPLSDRPSVRSTSSGAHYRRNTAAPWTRPSASLWEEDDNAASAPQPAVTEEWDEQWDVDSPKRRWPLRFRLHLPRRRRSRILLAIVCVCLLAGSLGSFAAYAHYDGVYQKDMGLAHQGAAELQAVEPLMQQVAANPFAPQVISQAQQHFSAAFTDFSQINQDLQAVPSGATLLPHYGSLLSAASHLVPIAVEASQAGIISCEGLNLIISRVHDPLNAQSQGLTADDMQQINQYFTQLTHLFTTATNQINQLQPGDLSIDPRLGPLVTTLKQHLPALEQGFQEVQSILGLAPTLLGIGKPANYLIEVLDSTELRPGGGFIGNYGILTLSGGRLDGLHITDVDLLDRPFEATGKEIPKPAVYNWFTFTQDWSFRDSNLDADFPTAAQYGEQNYHLEGGNEDVQGVIAITPWLIQDMLKITGPIYVPEYKETISTDNLIDRIHYHQLLAQEGRDDVPDPTGHSSLRKRFTEILFEHFFARVQQLASTDMLAFYHLFTDGLHSKDIQVYFNAAPAEALLQRYQLASAIEAPAAGDSLLLVDANVTPSKANSFISYTLNDQITLDSAGNAVHQTTLTYSWPDTPANRASFYWTKTAYSDYVRIYAPPKGVLEMQQGWKPAGTSSAFGREVWAGLFSLTYGKTGTIVLVWQVPHAATSTAAGWQYQLLLQKQPGITWQLSLQLNLPTCASVKSVAGGLTLPGRQSAIAKLSLTTDLTFTVNYTCQAGSSA
jgi:hypothetical protein